MLRPARATQNITRQDIINRTQPFCCLYYEIPYIDCIRKHQEGNDQERSCTVEPASDALPKHSYSPANKPIDTGFSIQKEYNSLMKNVNQ